MSQTSKQWLGILLPPIVVAALIILGSGLGFFNVLEWLTLDQFFRSRKEGVDDRIVVVTFDEPDIEYINSQQDRPWPMSDGVMAKMIENIKAQNPRVIALDVYRDFPVQPGHDELVEVFENTPNFIGIEKISGTPIKPPPALAELNQVAANDVLTDGDGKIRRGIVLLGKPDGKSTILGFGIAPAMQYLAKDGIELEAIDGEKQIFGLGDAKFVPLSGNDGQYGEKDMGGYQILMNYRGGLESFPEISLTEVLENNIPEGLMDDRIVFIGSKAPSLNDNYPTPYNNNSSEPQDLVPGVVVHANLTSQVLSAAVDGRPMMRPLNKYVNWGLILFWCGSSAFLGRLFIKKWWITVGGIVLSVVIIIGGSYIAFTTGWLVPMFTPFLAVTTSVVASTGLLLWNNLMLSFRQLEDYARNLEDKVKERTAELASANDKISTLNEKLKAENLRMSAELDVLKEMQQLILPNTEELEGIEGLDIAGFMEPADEVGGDYYDVLTTDGIVTLGIGDVTGHGLESGILMVMTQACVRTLQEVQEQDPVKFLDVLNRTVYKNVERMNSEKNLTLAILNYAEGRVSISGQHEETIVVRTGGEVECVDTMDLGFPIGLDDDIAAFIDQTSIHLSPGDGIVLYTDGIPEAYDINKKQYGLEQLCEIISQNWQHSAQDIQKAIIDDVRRHIGKQKVFDDITLVVMKQK